MKVDMGRGIAVIDLVLHMYRRSPTRRKLAELWCVSRCLAMRRAFFFQPCAKFHSRSHRDGQALACRSPNPSARSLTRRDSYTRFPRPIGVIARADRTRFIAPAPAWTRRAKYTEDSADELKWKGFELVRVHHQTLTRMFCEDPDGECFDIDDIRCVWEEFVDALRDASAKAGDPRPKDTSTSYADVEQPALQRSPSFARLVENLSSEASGASTPGTPTIDLVSRHGMILGVGCSSRDNSARGGSEYFRRMQGDKGNLDAAALVEQLHKRGLARIPSGKTLAFD